MTCYFNRNSLFAIPLDARRRLFFCLLFVYSIRVASNVTIRLFGQHSCNEIKSHCDDWVARCLGSIKLQFHVQKLSLDCFGRQMCSEWTVKWTTKQKNTTTKRTSEQRQISRMPNQFQISWLAGQITPPDWTLKRNIFGIACKCIGQQNGLM